jgi:low affinity Fe/Cu permease
MRLKNGIKGKRTSLLGKMFDSFSTTVTNAAGSPLASIVAFLVILVWAITGPIFNFSDTWQLVINTGTTVVTFLMVFIIQQSQNKETRAIQLKLNELIASNEKASNRLIDIEDLTDEELLILKRFYVKLAELSLKEKDLHSTHSIDEAEDIHERKRTKSNGNKD